MPLSERMSDTRYERGTCKKMGLADWSLASTPACQPLPQCCDSLSPWWLVLQKLVLDVLAGDLRGTMRGAFQILGHLLCGQMLLLGGRGHLLR